MTLTNEILLLVGAIAVGMGSTYLILRRQRRDRAAKSPESPFATSTEGEKRCPNCGMFNLWMATTCVSCKRRLPG